MDVTKETSLSPCFGYNKGNKEILRPQRRAHVRGMSTPDSKRLPVFFGCRTTKQNGETTTFVHILFITPQAKISSQSTSKQNSETSLMSSMGVLTIRRVVVLITARALQPDDGNVELYALTYIRRRLTKLVQLKKEVLEKIRLNNYIRGL